MASAKYRSLKLLDIEPILKHFKEQASGQHHDQQTNYSPYGSFHSNKGLIVIRHANSTPAKAKQELNIQTIDPVQSSTNQAASMLKEQIKSETETKANQSVSSRGKRRITAGSAKAQSKKRTKKVQDIFED